MNNELNKQVAEYLESGDDPAVAKVLLKLLIAALKEKEWECDCLKIDISSERHSRAQDNANPLDYI